MNGFSMLSGVVEREFQAYWLESQLDNGLPNHDFSYLYINATNAMGFFYQIPSNAITGQYNQWAQAFTAIIAAFIGRFYPLHIKY